MRLAAFQYNSAGCCNCWYLAILTHSATPTLDVATIWYLVILTHSATITLDVATFWYLANLTQSATGIQPFSLTAQLSHNDSATWCAGTSSTWVEA